MAGCDGHRKERRGFHRSNPSPAAHRTHRPLLRRQVGFRRARPRGHHRRQHFQGFQIVLIRSLCIGANNNDDNSQYSL